jgi:hypothetical protein
MASAEACCEATPEQRGPEASPRLVDRCVGTSDMTESYNEAYECNICLELAKDPVVTLCGHLYCWSCLWR